MNWIISRLTLLRGFIIPFITYLLSPLNLQVEYCHESLGTLSEALRGREVIEAFGNLIEAFTPLFGGALYGVVKGRWRLLV